jgi:hypothetical protein
MSVLFSIDKDEETITTGTGPNEITFPIAGEIRALFIAKREAEKAANAPCAKVFELELAEGFLGIESRHPNEVAACDDANLETLKIGNDIHTLIRNEAKRIRAEQRTARTAKGVYKVTAAGLTRIRAAILEQRFSSFSADEIALLVGWLKHDYDCQLSGNVALGEVVDYCLVCSNFVFWTRETDKTGEHTYTHEGGHRPHHCNGNPHRAAA